MIGQWKNFRRWPALTWMVNLVIPLALFAALATVLAFSEVPPSVWFLSGDLIEGAYVAYAVVLVAIIVRPFDWRLNAVGAPLSVLVFVGRAGGFLGLVLDGRLDLLGAVAERVALCVCAVTWHMFKSWRAGLAENGLIPTWEYNDRGRGD